DAFGNVYITGTTRSTNFPTTPGAFQVSGAASPGGSCCAHGFIYKLSTTGALVYSTYLGGAGNDYPSTIVVGATGDAYVTGWTRSRDFPVTPGAFQSQLIGGSVSGAEPYSDAFVTRLNAAGNALVYSTYLGGA